MCKQLPKLSGTQLARRAAAYVYCFQLLFLLRKGVASHLHLFAHSINIPLAHFALGRGIEAAIDAAALAERNVYV